jgi:iron complex transport system substrate-binding protein
MMLGYRLTLLAAISLAFATGWLAQKRLDGPAQPEVFPQWRCHRIVSMAPSITETLYALGLGDRVRGVTRFCNYPPEVEQVKKTGCIGGFFDPNLEKIVALKPDLVVMLEEQAQAIPNFDKLKLETLVVSHKTIDGIIDSFRTIGRVCNKGAEGRNMADDFANRIQCLRAQTRRQECPSVLFVVHRAYGCGHLADLYVAAQDDYIDPIIDLAGGRNACRRRGVRYPVVSSEDVVAADPDVIVDLVSPEVLRKFSKQAILEDWNGLKNVKAVRDHRVFLLDKDYTIVPGPRFLHLAEDLARQLHPEPPPDAEEEESMP